MGYMKISKRAPRRFRRKRGIRRRRYYKRRNRKVYGQVNMRLEVVRPILYRAGLAWAPMTVNWADDHIDVGAGVAANDYIRITDSGEWAGLAGVYNEYKVTYAKMKFLLADFHGGGGAASFAVYDCNVATDPNHNLNLSTATFNDLLEALDYKTFSGSLKVFGKGIAVQKYAKKFESTNGWLRIGDDPIHPRTHFRFSVAGFGDGDRVGTMYMTYYVSFRNRLI